MDISSLRTRFGIPGTLTFDEQNGLTRLHISTEQAEAAMYLQGAHMAHWQPARERRVLFLSRKSELAPGKPIRGGIPIAFPWFAADSKRDRIDGHPGPAHGFARLQEWTLQAVHRTADGVVLRLDLGATEMSRSMGFDHFFVRLEATIGTTLTMELRVENHGANAFSFEEAFHNYFDVMDVHEATVQGLEPTSYVDKMDHMQPKAASGAAIGFNGPVDRVYLDTEAPLTILDGTQRRKIRIRKTNSHTTVVWNPAKGLPDLGEWEWHEMVCVETANAGSNAVTIAPGDSFTMAQQISVQK